MFRFGKIEIYSVVAAAGTADHNDYRKDVESQGAHWLRPLFDEGHLRLALLSWEPPCLAGCPCTRYLVPSVGFPSGQGDHPSSAQQSPDASGCAPPRLPSS